jgi:DNA primase
MSELSDAVKDEVRMSTVLRAYRVDFTDSGEPEQLHCPFHGADLNRSARLYPENDEVYCFVCDKTWDVIEFVKDMEELPFPAAVDLLARTYGVHVTVPDYVQKLRMVKTHAQDSATEMAETVERLFREAAETLTSGNISSILSVYNECLAAKDDFTATEMYTSDDMKEWYESSIARLRTEFYNG